jgi:hypothetical protein
MVSGHYFVDEQRRVPYRLWHHQHHFREIEGGVEMTDIVPKRTEVRCPEPSLAKVPTEVPEEDRDEAGPTKGMGEARGGSNSVGTNEGYERSSVSKQVLRRPTDIRRFRKTGYIFPRPVFPDHLPAAVGCAGGDGARAFCGASAATGLRLSTRKDKGDLWGVVILLGNLSMALSGQALTNELGSKCPFFLPVRLIPGSLKCIFLFV